MDAEGRQCGQQRARWSAGGIAPRLVGRWKDQGLGRIKAGGAAGSKMRAGACSTAGQSRIQGYWGWSGMVILCEWAVCRPLLGAGKSASVAIGFHHRSSCQQRSQVAAKSTAWRTVRANADGPGRSNTHHHHSPIHTPAQQRRPQQQRDETT